MSPTTSSNAESRSLKDLENALSKCLSTEPPNERLHNALSSLHQVVSQRATLSGDWEAELGNLRNFAASAHLTLSRRLRVPDSLRRLATTAARRHTELDAKGFHSALTPHIYHCITLRNLSDCIGADLYPILTSLSGLFKLLEVFFRPPVTSSDPETALASVPIEHVPPAAGAKVQDASADRYIALLASQRSFLYRMQQMAISPSRADRLRRFVTTLTLPLLLDPKCIQCQPSQHPVLESRIVAKNHAAYIEYASLKVMDGSRHLWDAAIALKFFEITNNSRQHHFSQEALRVRTLAHPCIPLFHGHHTNFQEDGKRCVVVATERMSCDLRAAKNLQFLSSFENRVRVLRDVANALAFLHKNRVYHASLKPENVLLRMPTRGWHGPAKLDVTCVLRRALQLSLNRPRIYEPPEVYSNGFEAYYTGDIWSFGVLATFLFTDGCSEEDDTEFFKLAMKKGFLFPATAWGRRVRHSRVRNLIGKCLAERPTHRITAQQLVEEIQDIFRFKDASPQHLRSNEKEFIFSGKKSLDPFLMPPIAEGLHYDGSLGSGQFFGTSSQQGRKFSKSLGASKSLKFSKSSSPRKFSTSDHSDPNVVSGVKREPQCFRELCPSKRRIKTSDKLGDLSTGERWRWTRRRLDEMEIDTDSTLQDEGPTVKPISAKQPSRLPTEIPHIDLTGADANSILQDIDEDAGSLIIRRKRRRLLSPVNTKEKGSPSGTRRGAVKTSPKTIGKKVLPAFKAFTESPNRVSLQSLDARVQNGIASELSSFIEIPAENDLASKRFQVRSTAKKELPFESIYQDRKRRETCKFSSHKGNSGSQVSVVVESPAHSALGVSKQGKKHNSQEKYPSSLCADEPGNEVLLISSSQPTTDFSEKQETTSHGTDTRQHSGPHGLPRKQIKVKCEPEKAATALGERQQSPVTQQEFPCTAAVPHKTKSAIDTFVNCEPGLHSNSGLYDSAAIVNECSSDSVKENQKKVETSKSHRRRRRSTPVEGNEQKDEKKSSKLDTKVVTSSTPWAGRMRKRASRRYFENAVVECSDSDSIGDFMAPPGETSVSVTQPVLRADYEKKIFKQLFSIHDKGLANVSSSMKKTQYGDIGFSGNGSCFLDSDVQGIYALGNLKGSKDGLDPFQYFKREAGKGDTMAQVRLGILYENGVHCQRDYGEAFVYFELASSMENNEGRLRLARCYEEGRGVSKNESAAVALYLQAAAANSPVAHYKAAKCFLEGRGAMRDVKRAVLHLEDALKGDLLEAAYCLAELYSEGKHVQQDHARAFFLYGSAAHSGFLPAKVKFAHCFAKGKGCRRNISKAVEYYRKAAAAGDPEALLSMGLLYEDGNGVKASKQKALDSYIKSARQMYPPGITALGQCYLWGYGVEQDFNKAKALFEKSADLFDALALLELGNCHRDGKGCNKDTKKAVEYYRKACEQGNSVAMVEYGECYYYGKEVELDYDQAFAFFQKAADLGAAEGYRWLGDCYTDAIGAAQDYKRATQMYRKAIELGSAAAQNRLGKMYELGYGVDKSKTKALHCYRKAAEKGNDTALNNLGISYEKGELVKQDHAKAVSYYMKAKDLGCIDAICNLADCYALGHGVEKNMDSAFKLYKEAAENGLPGAVCELGVCYYKGLGVAQNHKRAIKLLEGIKGEEPEALRQLGIIYYDGIAVPQNRKMAFELFKESIANGNKNACLSLAVCLLNGEGVERDEKGAVDALRVAAYEGNKAAYMMLGNCYYDGIGVEKDMEQAAECFKKGEDADPQMS
ncbi:unnamed protein product [Agarophyton chilense]|eukprot:gb/GEZJ01001747.1/.p1 GENE.gb/GEZJ01001747.1/~~gb/GEZJ01001747.1/.p1  ORF type:complete len:1755 (-),score=252.31 gb/GEZJ01001747.1/:841-6105(-)